jgi:hypothetical protein
MATPWPFGGGPLATPSGRNGGGELAPRPVVGGQATRYILIFCLKKLIIGTCVNSLLVLTWYFVKFWT